MLRVFRQDQVAHGALGGLVGRGDRVEAPAALVLYRRGAAKVRQAGVAGRLRQACGEVHVFGELLGGQWHAEILGSVEGVGAMAVCDCVAITGGPGCRLQRGGAALSAQPASIVAGRGKRVSIAFGVSRAEC